ncbi:MAG TPA: RodZ domain-containing protein [Candidatus Limnocylindria bacterium]|nr:RodZ domain-containing protein [Candidatus Limnocylindria bacterium]
MTDQVHKLGEVLRAAREAKGVDLPRVERETKIRERYLSALERGEYRELPGAVYTKGFLRNYGAYLGLDPEYLIDLYRLETAPSGPERQSQAVPPRPLAARRARAFVVTPAAIGAAILTILVGAFVVWLAYEFVNFARTPDLRIIDPPGNVSRHTELTITVRGETAENATVTFSGLRENPTVTADATGYFEATVSLVPGSNVISIVAEDPVTGRSSATEERRVTVATEDEASPTPGAVALVVNEPAADATTASPVAVSGTTTPGGTVTVAASLVAAPALDFTVTDGGGSAVDLAPTDPAAPEPATLTADESGAFTSSLALAAGTWDVTVTPPSGDPVTRRVTVTAGDGLTAVLTIGGGGSYLEVEEDGTALADVSGGIAADGETIELNAATDVRIRAGNAGAVRVRVNGVDLGTMGGAGEVVEWRVSIAE